METAQNYLDRAMNLLPTGTYALFAYIATVVTPAGSCDQGQKLTLWISFGVVLVATMVLAVYTRTRTPNAREPDLREILVSTLKR